MTKSGCNNLGHSYSTLPGYLLSVLVVVSIPQFSLIFIVDRCEDNNLSLSVEVGYKMPMQWNHFEVSNHVE